MPHFPTKLEDATEEDLKKWSNDVSPQYASLASQELMRRRFDQFDKSTTYFSKILGFFAVVQIVVAVMQFILGVMEVYDNFWEQLVIMIILFLVISFIFLIFYRITKNSR